MQIFHPVFDWWLGSNQFASRIFAFHENAMHFQDAKNIRFLCTQKSDRANVARAIPQSVIGGVGFLLNSIQNPNLYKTTKLTPMFLQLN